VATIRQKRPGVWEVRVFTGRDERGRPTQVSRTVHGGKKEAQRVAAELTARPAARSGGRTVSALLAEWFALKEDTWAASSRRDRQSRIEFIDADPIAKIPVARLSVADVERWIARMRKAGIGDGAIRNRHQTLRAALSQAVRWGWITVNPAALAEVRQPKRAPRGAMTPADVQRVIDTAARIDRAAALALRLAAVTGARRSELAALRWVDLDGDRLVIDSAIETVRTGRKGDPGVPTLTDVANKTATRRVVVLDPATVALATSLREEREPAGPWMFSIGDRAPNPDRVGAWWRLARKRSGIDTTWRLHDLRHWSATYAIGHGHDVRAVAHRLGHADPSLTLRVYTAALESVDRAVAVSLGAALDGPAGA
jgi:integrase